MFFLELSCFFHDPVDVGNLISASSAFSKTILARDALRTGLTSHLPRRPVSCSRDQMLWMRPACSGWLLVFPQAHWCFSISVSYTRPAAGEAGVAALREALGVPGSWSPYQGSGAQGTCPTARVLDTRGSRRGRKK